MTRTLKEEVEALPDLRVLDERDVIRKEDVLALIDAHKEQHNAGVEGKLCDSCKGEGEWSDAGPGDIYCNHYRCKACEGRGGFGLTGDILRYLRKSSLGHDEVDAPNIARIAFSALNQETGGVV